jgi:hypothetical protein
MVKESRNPLSLIIILSHMPLESNQQDLPIHDRITGVSNFLEDWRVLFTASKETPIVAATDNWLCGSMETLGAVKSIPPFCLARNGRGCRQQELAFKPDCVNREGH